jgi:GT2 family glycosyltransferase
MSSPTATIVVLSYNGKEVTKKFLECLYENTSSEFNLIMIDNGSTDGTKEYLEDALFLESKNTTLVLNQENLGVIGGRNMGFTLYQSNPTDYLFFLDNDQFVQKHWMHQYLAFLAAGDYDLVGADAWLMDSAFMPRHNCKRSGEPFTYVGCGGMMMKKKVVDTIGMFDEQFNPAYFEDPDFNFRARKAGLKIGWNHEAKVIHMPHQTLGKNKDRMEIFRQSYDKFRKKWDGQSFPPMKQAAHPVIISL